MGKWLLTVMVSLAGLMAAQAALADPAWFPRETIAYAELHKPTIGWNAESFTELAAAYSLPYMHEPWLAGVKALSPGLVSAEIAITDFRYLSKMPVNFAMAALYEAAPDVLGLAEALFHAGMVYYPDEHERWPSSRDGRKRTSVELDESHYGGYRLASVRGALACFAVKGNVVLLATTNWSLRDMIDQANGTGDAGDSLASQQRFATWLKQHPAGSQFARVFVDGPSVVRLIDLAVPIPERLRGFKAACWHSDLWLEWRKISYASLITANDGRFSTTLSLEFREAPAWAPLLAGGEHRGLEYLLPRSTLAASLAVGDLARASELASGILAGAEAEIGAIPRSLPEALQPGGQDYDVSRHGPRGLDGETKRPAEEWMQEIAELGGFAWRTAIGEFCQDREGIPPLVTASTVSETIGAPWLLADLFGFKPESIGIGAIDANTGVRSGTVLYRHRDGSSFWIDLADDDGHRFADEVGETGALPESGPDTAPFSRASYREGRLHARCLGLFEAARDMGKVVALVCGVAEKELYSVLSGNLIAGQAVDRLASIVGASGHRQRLGEYWVLPVRDDERAGAMLQRLYGAMTVEPGHPAGAESFWNFSALGARIHIPIRGQGLAVALTNNALIVCDPGLVFDLLDHAADIDTWTAAHAAPPGAIAFWADTRNVHDLSHFERLPVRSLPRADQIPSLALSGHAGFSGKTLVVAFELREPLPVRGVVPPESGNDQAEMTIVAEVHDSCTRIALRALAAGGKPQDPFPSWQDGVTELINTRREQEADKPESEDGSGGSDLADIYASRWMARSAVFPDINMYQVWRLLPADPRDSFRRITSMELDICARVLAVSEVPYEGYRLLALSVVDDPDGSMMRSSYFTRYGDTPFLATEAAYERLRLAMESGTGVPAHLLDTPTTTLLTDREALMALERLWAVYLRHEIQRLLDRNGRWKYKGGDSYHLWNLGVLRRTGPLAEGLEAEDATADDSLPPPAPGSVIRMTGFGHWADLDRRSNIVDASWRRTLAGSLSGNLRPPESGNAAD